jgi:hypothetical protein
MFTLLCDLALRTPLLILFDRARGWAALTVLTQMHAALFSRRGEGRHLDFIERFHNPIRWHSTIAYLGTMSSKKVGLA